MYPSTREGRQEDPKSTQWHIIKIIMIITQNSNSDLILHFEGILRSFIISLILEPICPLHVCAGHVLLQEA